MEDTDMMEFRCTDIGLKCHVTIRGKNEEDLVESIAKHTELKHGIREPDEKLLKRIKGAIRQI